MGTATQAGPAFGILHFVGTGMLEGMHARASLLIFAAAVLAIACGPEEDWEFEGIYEFERMTLNVGSCEDEGESILDTLEERYMGLVMVNTDDVPPWWLYTCPDVPECLESSERIRDPGPPPVTAWTMAYFDVETKHELQGVNTLCWFTETGVCDEVRLSQVQVVRQDGGIRFERHTKNLGPRPPRAGDACCFSADELESEATSLPCVELLVAEATQIDEL